LWESWNGDSSLNHIMFGDISAWMYQYLTGLRPDPENPGFRHMIIEPQPVSGLEWAKTEYDSPYGKITIAWKNHNGDFKIEVQIPDKTTATVVLPDSTTQTVKSGKHSFNVKYSK